MRVRIVLFLAVMLLLSGFVSAGEEWLDYHALRLNLSLGNAFNAVSRGSGASVQEVSGLLSWFPSEDYRQSVSVITTEPGAEFKDGEGFLFEWKKPASRNFLLTQKSELTTKSEFLPVSKKIAFPLDDVDAKYAGYLEPTEIIDENDNIRALASTLVEGETDEFLAVSKLAVWVEENIKYTLSTKTADASQKSSWVLENRQGVCDELTSLFISMCRSLGIPARFVSGVSYSNINLQNDGWGPHGWAEVYFPDVGWVPFDVTYRELGYVDATHIKLKVSPDAKEDSVEYSIVGQNVDINASSLSFQVTVTGSDYILHPLVAINASVMEDVTGLGSFNLIEVSLRNDNAYYVSGAVQIANVSDLKIIDVGKFNYALPPFSEKKIYWVVKVEDGLSSRYEYTFPIVIYSDRHQEVRTSFKSQRRGQVFSEEYVRSMIPLALSSMKPNTRFIELNCAPNQSKAYINERVRISCSLRNTGEKSLDLRACLETNCTRLIIEGGDAEEFEYSESFNTLGVKTLVFKADGSQASKTAYAIVSVGDEPIVRIANLSFPESIGFDEKGEFRFLLKRDSVSKPIKVELCLEHDLISERWLLPEIEDNYEIRFLFKGSEIGFGKNKFNLSLSYEDEEGRQYRTEHDFTVSLNEPTLLQRLLLWVNIGDAKLSRWIRRK
jgi:transglutaminase-like putative cysteine protease